MARRLRTTTSHDIALLHRAVDSLRVTRDLLKAAGAVRAAQYTRAALKSAEGALRHAMRAAQFED